MKLKQFKSIQKKKNPKKKHERFFLDHRGEGVPLEQAWVTLRRAGLKRTPIRDDLLRFLIQNHGPFSKDEIQRDLPREDMDSVTLYRNLSHFEKAGVVRRSEFGDGISRYEFQSSPEHHHHHVICVKCRQVESLSSCEVPELEAMVRRLGYVNIKHSLEFYGVCPNCHRKPHSTEDKG